MNIGIVEQMAECDAKIQELRLRKTPINNKIAALGSDRHRSAGADRALKRLTAELCGIETEIRQLAERKLALHRARDVAYERAFLLATKEILGEEACRSIHDRAAELLEERRRRASSLGVGSAIPVLGGAAGVRVRRGS